MNDDSRAVAGAKLDKQEQAKLDSLARRIRGSRSDVLRAFINLFTEDELANRLADALRNPKDSALTMSPN